MIGSILGYDVTLIMPENASEERKKRILAHGANIIFTDAMLGYDESLHEVKRIYEKSPEQYFYCDQYSNSKNPYAHYNSTGSELIKQLPEITHFVAGIGTGGEAFKVSKILSKKGFFVGQSSGAYVLGAIETAKSVRRGQIGTIFNDLGERYFSTSMWG